jgi:PAS domain S-box-containing protein
VIDALHRAVIVSDADGRIVSWNRAAEQLYGWSEHEVLGRALREVLVPAGVHGDAEEIVDTVRGGGDSWDGDFSVLHREGRPLRVHAIVRPVVAASGDVIGLVGVSEDVTERRLEEQRTRQLAEHLALALEAGGLGTWRWDIATGETIWDAKLETLFGLEPGTFDGTYDSYTALLHPDDRHNVLGIVDDAVRERSSYVIEHRVVWGDGSVHWLQGKGEVITDDSGAVVGTMGCVADVTDQMHAAAELERAIQGALDAADRERLSAQRLEFIGHVNDALSQSATRNDVMTNITQLAVPGMGDFCAMYVLPTPDAKLPTVEFAHQDPSVVEHLREMAEGFRSGGAANTIVARVMQTGEPVFVPRVDDEIFAAANPPEQVRDAVRRFGFSSAMIVPLIKNRRIIGALQFVNAEGSRTYTQADLALAMAIASRVASTLENRRLAEQQREIAMTLQASLLPSMLPEIPGVDVAVRYWAAGEGTAVGGDFYDVFGLDERRWAAVIGDVCGTGPAAAALTGLARHTIRASAWHGAPPDEVLAQLNTAVLRCGQRTFCTALYCELAPEPDGVRFAVAAGGHPLPVVQRAHGKCETFGEPGTLLGLFEDSRSTTTSTVLLPDDFVVLYTDGVTDLPPPNALTPEDVCEIIDDALISATTADELAAGLGRALEERIPFAERDDDIALLVLRIVAAQA